MTELRPILESSNDELELALLGALRAERPRPAGLRDAALALGLGVGAANALAASLSAAGPLGGALTANAASLVGPLSGTGGAATSGVIAGSVVSAAGATGGSGAAGAVGVMSLATLAKSLLGGALVSFVGLTTLDQAIGKSSSDAPAPVHVEHAARRMNEASLPQPTPVSTLAASVAAELAPAPTLPPSAARRRAPSGQNEPAAPAELEPARPAPARAAFEPPPPAPTAPTVTPDASLAAEIRLLDQARAALAASDSERAGQLLDAYASGRPSLVLAQEAALLRVQLFLARGQRQAAADLARRIIARNPESAHADSLRRLAAEP